jgi:small-conductance mechanosensitive channel
MHDWHRLVVVAVVVTLAFLISEVADRAMGRRKLEPGVITRYRVLRRSIRAGIVFVGVLSALLVIPQVRVVAGGILASSAILGIAVGFAARSTLANVIAGLMIAVTQPLRLGDLIETGGREGVVEEIGLIYTFITLDDGSRLVVPNEKLASDTIRNASMQRREAVAQVSVQIPLGVDLDRVVNGLEEMLAGEQGLEVYVSELSDRATLQVRTTAPDARSAEQAERALRLRTHDHLREQGVLS